MSEKNLDVKYANCYFNRDFVIKSIVLVCTGLIIILGCLIAVEKLSVIVCSMGLFYSAYFYGIKSDLVPKKAKSHYSLCGFSKSYL